MIKFNQILPTTRINIQNEEKNTRFITLQKCLFLILIGGIIGIIYTVFTLSNYSSISDNVGKIRMLSERTSKEALGITMNYMNVTHCNAKNDLNHLFNELSNNNGPLKNIKHYYYEVQESLSTFENSGTSTAYENLNLAVKNLVNKIHKINHYIANKSYSRAYIILSGIGTFIIAGIFVLYKLYVNIIITRMEMKVKNKTMSQVCHEIRGHMAVIKFGLEETYKYFNDQNNTEIMNIISASLIGVKSQESILANRLELHKLISGNLIIKSINVELVTLIRSLIGQYNIINKKITIDIIIPANEVWINSDPHFIERAIQNLLNNSIKYTYSGKITIKLIKDPYLKISIEDTGIGIPKEKQEKIFQTANIIDDERGSGMGLHFVTTIMKAMDGDVKLEFSEVGVGSVFTLMFYNIKPQCINCSITIANKENIDDIINSIPNNIKVLLVDDQEMIRKIFINKFKKFTSDKGWIISEANTAEEAIIKVEQEKFDVVIMDQNMENKGGIIKGKDALIKIHNDGYKCICILCSGDDIESCNEIQINWGKPIPSTEIIFKQLKNIFQRKEIEHIDNCI
jgi:anti-sigma regulatory factor (Ser/Thr protein kinase)